jgi:hypothetical protein
MRSPTSLSRPSDARPARRNPIRPPQAPCSPVAPSTPTGAPPVRLVNRIEPRQGRHSLCRPYKAQTMIPGLPGACAPGYRYVALAGLFPDPRGARPGLGGRTPSGPTSRNIAADISSYSLCGKLALAPIVGYSAYMSSYPSTRWRLLWSAMSVIRHGYSQSLH